MVTQYAKSVHQDQMLQNVMSDQGLYCLPLIQQDLDTSTGSRIDFCFQIFGQVL